MPGGDDARPVDPTVVDGTRQRDVEQVTARFDEQPEVATRREARQQRRAAVDDPPQGAERGVVLDVAPGVSPVRAAHEHVELHVHEAGEQRDVPEVELVGGGRELGRVHRGDAVAVDDDDRGRANFPRVDVDPAVSPKNDGRAHGTGSNTRSR